MENNPDYEYIKYLMLYSDQKYPFEKAKSDPGLTQSVRDVKGYMSKHGNTRKLDHGEAKRILLNEEQGKKRKYSQFEVDARDVDPEIPQTRNIVENISNTQQGSKSGAELENELAVLKKMVMEKEAEIKANASKIIEKKSDESFFNRLMPNKKQESPQSDGGIVERKLEDTGYSDKINNI